MSRWTRWGQDSERFYWASCAFPLVALALLNIADRLGWISGGAL